jgi:hypothetical protein
MVASPLSFFALPRSIPGAIYTSVHRETSNFRFNGFSLSPDSKGLGDHFVKAAFVYADILTAFTVYPTIVTNNSRNYFFNPVLVAAQYLTRSDLVIAPELSSTGGTTNNQHYIFFRIRSSSAGSWNLNSRTLRLRGNSLLIIVFSNRDN